MNAPSAGFPINPTVSVAGVLQINAPYVSLDGSYQGSAFASSTGSAATTTFSALPAPGRSTFSAQALDVTGAVQFDPSVAKVTLESTGDLRFIGVAPLQVNGQPVTPSLAGQLAVSGDLNPRRPPRSTPRPAAHTT